MAKMTQEDMRPTLDEAGQQAQVNRHTMGLWQFSEAIVDDPTLGRERLAPQLVSTCSSCSATITVSILYDNTVDEPHGTAIDYPCPNLRT